jgi:hypothetical protein
MAEETETVDELEQDDTEHTEELDDETDADDAADDGDATEERSAERESSTGNRFKDLQSRLGNAFSAPKKSSPTADEESDEDADDDEDADREDSDRESEEDPESDDDKDGDEDDDKAAKEDDEEDGADGANRFEIVNKAGEKFALDIDDDTVIRFQGDGRTIECTSMDEVIQLAQKGAAFDRVTSRQGQELAELRRSTSTKIEGLEAQLTEAEETLLKVVTDPKAFKRVRNALKPYQSPEAREGLEAKRKLAAKDEEERTTRETQQREAVDAFWQGVDSEISKQLGEFEYLEKSDRDDVVRLFYGQYENTFKELVQKYGNTDAGVDRANREARALLTEKHLTRAMRTLNDRYAKRAGKGGGEKKGEKPGKPPKGGKPARQDEAAGKRAAAKHNKHVEEKLEQRKASRTMRGGGAAPAGKPSPDAKAPQTFDGKMNRAFGRLRKLAGSDE